jgi:PKHD-type hydroxylase
LSLPRNDLNTAGVGISTENTGNKQDTRRSKTSFYPYESIEAKTINKHILPFVTLANKENFGFALNNFYELQYTEYHSREHGFYDWHQDVLWLQPTESQRKISVSVQLSDDDEYEGGDFEFHKDIPQPSDIRSRGTVIVFPSFLYHRVTEVTKGERKSLVAWYEGSNFN